MKNDYPIHIIRVGIAITFLWIGLLIFKSPEAWGQFLLPWAIGLLPISISAAMIGTAILDFTVGFFLLLDLWTFAFAILGFTHLLLVIAVAGINDVTARDIGLAAGLLALIIRYWPKK